jgi:hypothetical protein
MHDHMPDDGFATSHALASFPVRASGLVGSTLCLMGCFARHRLAAFADRVSINLADLAHDAALTPELRAVCARLSARWAAIGDDARARTAAGLPATDSRALH